VLPKVKFFELALLSYDKRAVALVSHRSTAASNMNLAKKLFKDDRAL